MPLQTPIQDLRVSHVAPGEYVGTQLWKCVNFGIGGKDGIQLSLQVPGEDMGYDVAKQVTVVSDGENVWVK